MIRYLTHRYVAITFSEARRLAELDHTLEQDIHVTECQLLHRTPWWAWWSDGMLTTAVGLPSGLEANHLSACAATLLELVWFSRSQISATDLGIVASVQSIESREKLMVRAEWQQSLERVWVTTSQRTQQVLYLYSAYASDQYIFELTSTCPLHRLIQMMHWEAHQDAIRSLTQGLLASISSKGSL